MLSEHEFVVAVRDEIYPKVCEIETRCLNLYNMKYSPGIGPTGYSGIYTNELGWTVQLLRASANMLEKIYEDKKG